LIEASEDYRKRYLEIAPRFDGFDLLRFLKTTSEAMQQIKYVSQPRIKLEMTLLQLVSMERSVKLSELLRQVEELKKNLAQLNLPGSKVTSRQPLQNNSGSGSVREMRSPYSDGRSQTAPYAENSLKKEKAFVNPASSSELKISEGKPPAHPSTEASFQEITVRWEELLQAVRKERIGVWSQLINLKPLGIRNGWLMLGAPNEVVVGMTKPYKNYIQDTIQKTLGMRVAIDFTIVANEQPVDSNGNDPLIKYLKDEFGAEPIE